MRSVPLGWLQNFDGNAKLHPPEQLARLAASIKRFGFNSPVLALPDGTLIAGHGRVAAAALAGLTEVPCVVLDHLSPEEARAYTLADNRIAELGEWDEAALESELINLGETDPTLLDDAGYTPEEVRDLLEGETQTEDEMDYPETHSEFRCPHCGRVIGDDE